MENVFIFALYFLKQILIMERLLNYIKVNWLIFAGSGAGAVAGYMYWYFIGCQSGTCPITSSPLNSTIYGIIMGGLLFSMFKKEKKKNQS